MKKIRIAALGDSLTKGVILTDQNRYSIADCSFMDIISNELDTSVCNYGKFGCTVSFGNNVIDRHKDEITNSDYTFIEYGGNDCDFDWMKIADSPNEEHDNITAAYHLRHIFFLLQPFHDRRPEEECCEMARRGCRYHCQMARELQQGVVPGRKPDRSGNH